MLPTESSSTVPAGQEKTAAGEGAWRVWLISATFVAILVAHASRYMPFLSDDALISFRYSERLLDGRGLTWTDGRPVEGYSNLLWVLLTTGLGALGVDLIDAARLLGIVAMASVIPIASWWYMRDKRVERGWLPL